MVRMECWRWNFYVFCVSNAESRKSKRFLAYTADFLFSKGGFITILLKALRVKVVRDMDLSGFPVCQGLNLFKSFCLEMLQIDYKFRIVHVNPFCMFTFMLILMLWCVWQMLDDL